MNGLALGIALAVSLAATASAGAQESATSQAQAASPLNFTCSGIAVIVDGNGSTQNVPDQFRFTLWKDPWRATFDEKPIRDLNVTDDFVTFTPPSVSSLHSILRAYADVVSLGAAVKSRVIKLDRRTGVFASGYASGSCKLISAADRLF